MKVGRLGYGDEDANAIPLWELGKSRPEPWKYWKFVASDETKRLKIKETQFYILRSKEKIAVPPGIAIYCRASDETIGEMRIHYAGFAHPLFGRQRKDGKIGTPLIFEVRGHQVHVSLADGEKMANIIFYRMSQDCEGSKAGDCSMAVNVSKAYEEQNLQLSKFFAEWPDRLKKKGDDGTVEPA